MSLAESHQTPWHHRPAIIIALLVIVAPVGIALMWMRLPWPHRTKVAVSGVAGAWFVVMLVLGSLSKESADSVVPPRVSTARETPAASSSEPPPLTQPASTESGLALIGRDPLLLIPAKLDGFALALATPLPPKVAIGATAGYLGDNKHLVAHVTVNKSDVQLKAEVPLQVIKIGEHDATLGEDKTAKTITIAWSASGWNEIVTVDYERIADRSAAEQALKTVAPQVAAVLDTYLDDKPPPESERQQHVAALGRTAVMELIARIEKDGVTRDIISGAHQDPKAMQWLVTTVGSSWAKTSKSDRTAAARKLATEWANIWSPGDPESSGVKLVDSSGKSAGLVTGSSITIE